jgi:hypothetical protein
MVSFNKFIQEGIINQNGGFKVAELINNMIINDTGIYDKKTFNQLEIGETPNQSEIKDNIKIINISNQQINLGMDRILYGDLEKIEPSYSIEIVYRDYKKIINVEGEEYATNIINNYGKIFTYLNKMLKQTNNTEFTPMAQGIRAY